MLTSWEADGLSKDEVSRAAAAFRRHDHQKRGVLSPRAFSKVVKKLGHAEGHEYSESELEGLLK